MYIECYCYLSKEDIDKGVTWMGKKGLRNALKGLYILMILSLFLPWFTYNPKVMGYRFGYTFMEWFLIPLVILGIYLFKKENSRIMFALAELSVIANICLLTIAFGKWQDVCNIQTGFHWKDGFITALPTYWLSVAVFLAFSIVFQCVYVKNETKTWKRS